MANIFGQARDLIKMQQEARKLQAQLKQKVVVAESKDSNVVVKINGANELESIEISAEMLQPQKKALLEKMIKDVFKDAAKKLQREMAKDLDLGKVKSMLGM